MDVNFETLTKIVCGISYLSETECGYCFHRFTTEQEEYLKPFPYTAVYSSSGVVMRFKTNTDVIKFAISTSLATSKSIFSLDVFVDGKYFDSLRNFEDDEYPVEQPRFGDFEKTFVLEKNKEKEVEVYFPWSVNTILKKFQIDDTAYIYPVKRDKKFLIYGDSIAQGNYCLWSSNTYISRLCRDFTAEQYNKTIGGSIFLPGLLDYKDEYSPDVIIVGYGTNNIGVDREKTKKDTFEFFKKLRNNFPDTPIVAISPIWRGDLDTEEKEKIFFDIQNYILETANSIKNTVFVDGLNFFSFDKKLFGDGVLHPNDSCCEIFAEKLHSIIEKSIKK